LEKIAKTDLFDKIATEDNADAPDTLVEYLETVDHPALKMDALF